MNAAGEGIPAIAADDELEPERFAWLEAHIEGCEACRLEQSRFLEIDRDLPFTASNCSPHQSLTRCCIAPVAAPWRHRRAAAILFPQPTTSGEPRLMRALRRDPIHVAGLPLRARRGFCEANCRDRPDCRRVRRPPHRYRPP